jgi:prepilin-type N-terminal cleavage/methylation domain-containing protein
MNADRTPRAGRALPAPGRRGGYTLLEVAAVVALLGLMAVIAGLRFRPQTLTSLGTRVDSRCIATDLIRARRQAIVTSQNHLLVFRRGRGRAAEYTLSRRLTDGTVEAIDPPRTLPPGVAVTVEPGNPEFDPRGAPLAAYEITLKTDGVARRVTVAEATGSVYVSDP